MEMDEIINIKRTRVYGRKVKGAWAEGWLKLFVGKSNLHASMVLWYRIKMEIWFMDVKIFSRRHDWKSFRYEI